MRLIFYILTLILILPSCQNFSSQDASTLQDSAQSGQGSQGDDGPSGGGNSDPALPDPFKTMAPLAWESSQFPERTEWSYLLYDLVFENLDSLDLATDANYFCPNYNNLNDYQKVNFWAQLVSAVSYYESSWKPTTRFKEDMGIDPVTNKTVYSEGLLQLSYQDTLWAADCNFDWSKDKNLSPTDPKKTIFLPENNLECGLKILARQIKKYNAIVLSNNVYWAVLKKNGAYQKIEPISKIIKKHSYCIKK